VNADKPAQDEPLRGSALSSFQPASSGSQSSAECTGKQLNFQTLFSDIPTPVWVALSGVISGIGTWLVSMRQISSSLEGVRLKMNADAQSNEASERAAFRTALMADISELRVQMKECETDRDHLRTRVNAAEEQILVLRASNEIMERWLTFFKDRNATDLSVVPTRKQDSGSN
jgi:hypothetical protein